MSKLKQEYKYVMLRKHCRKYPKDMDAKRKMHKLEKVYKKYWSYI